MLSRWRARLRRRSIRARLIVAYTLISVVPFGLFGWLVLQAVDRYYLVRQQSDMRVEAGLIAQQAVAALSVGGIVEVPSTLLDPPPPLASQVRVLLFDDTGALAATSDNRLAAQIGQVLEEPGLSGALQGAASQGIENSTSAGEAVAYVAEPVMKDGRVIGAAHLSYTLTDIENAQRALSLAIVAATLTAVALTGVVSLWMTHGITQPLARLNAAAAEIGGGRFTRRVPEDAPLELAALASGFNRMAQALETAEEARRVTFANIAHDVRTPLGSIRAACEALASGAADDPALRERLLGGMVHQIQYLSRLTDDLLRLAAYEGGGLVVRRQATDLLPLIERSLAGVEPRAAAQQVQLKVNLPAHCPLVEADGDRVLEVLFNLLDNALTYTPPGGDIGVWVERESSQVWVHVADSGPGVTDEALQHLTERYWRGEWRTAGVRRVAGVNMGLGLSIVREIVLAHAGRLAVGNRPAGGADFAFSLPLVAFKPHPP